MSCLEFQNYRYSVYLVLIHNNILSYYLATVFSVVIFQLCFVYIGLDLVEVGRDDVTLRLGKQAARRQLQFALQSLVAIFGNFLDYSQIL